MPVSVPSVSRRAPKLCRQTTASASSSVIQDMEAFLTAPPVLAPLRASLKATCRPQCAMSVTSLQANPTGALSRRLCMPTRRRASWRCSLPQSYDHLESESDRSENQLPLAWKDRVALYAQFSAEETLDMLLQALRENNWSGPTKDDGIDALYAFANVDIWALTHTFFGRKMDLGQFERFKRVLVASPYDVLLRYRHVRTLSALRVDDETYVSRRAFEAPDGKETIFKITLSQTPFGGDEGGKRAWMVDSILHDQPQ